MLPYFILLIVPGIAYFCFRHSPKHEQADRRTLTVFFVLLYLLLALRHNTVGNDYETYRYYFETIGDMDWSGVFFVNIELGYALLNKIVSVFTDNFQWFLAVSSAIIILPVWYVYRKYLEDAPMTILLFINTDLFVMFFSGIRQSISVSLGCLAFIFVKEKKWVKYLLTVAVAILFHQSAFILLLLYPVCHYRLRKKSLYYLLPAYLVLIIFNRQIFSAFLSISGVYSNYRMSQTGAYTSIILFAIFSVYSIVIPDENKLDKTGKMLRNIMLLSLALVMFAPVHMLAMRLNYYFIIFMPLLIPKIVKYHDEKQEKLTQISKVVILVFFTCYFFYFGYSCMQSGAGLHFFPYHFFWEAV